MTNRLKTKLSSCVTHTEGDIDTLRINLGKCTSYIKMNFTTESAEKVVWTADGHMEYYNLPPMMIQHWTNVQELNGYLMDLVRFLSIGYRAANRPLNPLASEYIHQKNDKEDIKPNTGEKTNTKDEHSTNEWINKGRMFQRHSFFTNNKCANTNASNASINPCEVFSEKDEEGSNAEIEEESKIEKK